MADRLRVNKLVPKVASWVASAVARRVELWEDTLVPPPALAAPLVLPPALAARAAVLAFGDELLDLALPDDSDERSESGGSVDSGDFGDFGDLGESGSESGEISESDESGESSVSGKCSKCGGIRNSGESGSGSESDESDESGENGESGESSQVGLRWRQPGGRIFAAAYLLPRAEAALRQELQRLADAAKRARLAQTSSSSGSRAT